MERDDLIDILCGNVDLINNVNVRDVARFRKDDVLIRPKDVRDMLLKFLDHRISDEDLTKWAMFICLRGEYRCVLDDQKLTEEKLNQSADYYEDMMYVIQKLSTPQIDGEVNEQSVRQYLSELEKYGDEFDGGTHTFF